MSKTVQDGMPVSIIHIQEEAYKLLMVLEMVTLNGVMVIILHYITKFGSFGSQLRHSG